MKQFKGVQQEILISNSKNQLVSAGAGSGKTTVMIEKITDLLVNKNVSIDSILVVTFTVLAAQEMKERLIENLKEVIKTCEEEKKQNILKTIEKIDTASIDTIDGFSSKTIKKYFYDLNIAPNIEIITDASKDFYMTKAMEKTLNNKQNKNGELNLMLDLFGGNSRNLNEVKKLLLASYNNIINLKNPEQFLDFSLAQYIDSIGCENVVNEHMCNIADDVMKSIIGEFSYVSEKQKLKLQPLLDGLKQIDKNLSFKTNLSALMKLNSIRFSSVDYQQYPNLKVLSEKISTIFDFKKLLEKNSINEDFDEKNKEIYKILMIFSNFLKNFMKNYNNLKEKNNLIDFNDLNRLMLKLLENENIKKELNEKYSHIFIDEYQDVNPLQDELMNLLAGENTTMFMVGDVKQSIYGFRGSTPELFLKKNEVLKQNAEDVFNMNVNFRTSPTILKFVNDIFFKLMTKNIADIDYKTDCEIEPQRLDIVDEKVKVLIAVDDWIEQTEKGVYSVKNSSRENKKVSGEVVLVFETIAKLIGKEFYDAKKKEKRPLTYSDIAILTHSDKDEKSVELINFLKKQKVLLNQNNKLKTQDSELVKLILSILKCVNNFSDDVDYFATFMCLTDLSLDDVVKIRDKNSTFFDNLVSISENGFEDAEIQQKVQMGFEVLSSIRNATNTKTNKELINFILNEKKLKYYILKHTDGEKQLMMLNEFLNKISPMEDCLGLSEFVEMIEKNVNTSSDFLSTDGEDSVTIQTIHKSKGLEYPVVILFNANKEFAYLQEKDAINFNHELGFGLDYYDIANRTKSLSLNKFAIKLLNDKKGYKEELRLLYVALTRAKNKLIITGSVKNNELENLKQKSFLGMILSCYKNQISNGNFENENVEIATFEEVTEKDVKTTQKNKLIVKRENFVYPNANKFNIPIKNTVTGINSEHAQNEGYKVKDVLKQTTQYDNDDRIQIGIDYHSALEQLDLKSEYVKNTDFKNVDYDKIKKAHSILSELAVDSISIKKEAEFVMNVPYNEIVSSSISDKVLIQGVVDLIIEKQNSIVIVDYKFSKLPAKILKQKYSEQLRLYKMAVESAFKKPVEQVFIYSIENAELI